MTERDKVYTSLRKALEKSPRSPRPDIDWEQLIVGRRLEGESLVDCFVRNFKAVRGYWAESIPDLIAFLEKQQCRHGYCDPSLRETIGVKLEQSLTVDYSYTREKVDDLQFGVTRASAAIAETGTLVLKDSETTNRLAALAPWVHVAVLPSGCLHTHVREAIAAFESDPNIIWVTGPSKTADVEGILIEGVHGPGEQVCLMV